VLGNISVWILENSFKSAYKQTDKLQQKVLLS